MDDSNTRPRSGPRRVSRATSKADGSRSYRLRYRVDGVQRAVPIAGPLRHRGDRGRLVVAREGRARRERTGRPCSTSCRRFVERARLADSTKALYANRIREVRRRARCQADERGHGSRSSRLAALARRAPLPRASRTRRTRNTASASPGVDLEVRRPQRRRRRQPVLAVGLAATRSPVPTTRRRARSPSHEADSDRGRDRRDPSSAPSCERSCGSRSGRGCARRSCAGCAGRTSTSPAAATS